MLIVSGFTFFGLSILQNVSEFTDFFGDTEISFTMVMTNEEENETNTNNEVKEKSGKEYYSSNYHANCYLESKELLKYLSHQLNYNRYYLEVPTPPPEHIS